MNEIYLKFSINEHEINKSKTKKFKVGIQKTKFFINEKLLQSENYISMNVKESSIRR